MICPKCGGRVKVVAFITDYAVVDRIIDHLELTFVAAKLPLFDHLIFIGRESLCQDNSCAGSPLAAPYAPPRLLTKN